jgi:hypothetical protein
MSFKLNPRWTVDEGGTTFTWSRDPKINVRSLPSFSFTSSSSTIDTTPSTSCFPFPATDTASYPSGTSLALTLPETRYMETPPFRKEHVGFCSLACHDHDYKWKFPCLLWMLRSPRLATPASCSPMGDAPVIVFVNATAIVELVSIIFECWIYFKSFLSYITRYLNSRTTPDDVFEPATHFSILPSQMEIWLEIQPLISKFILSFARITTLPNRQRFLSFHY